MDGSTLHPSTLAACCLQAIREFTAATNKKLGIQMYPYSIFHIFFEQYLYVVQNSLWLLGGALLGVFAVCWAFTASLWASSIILLVVTMILMDLLGVMYLWGIQLNAVSVVNLTMALGIAVEFCAHIVHAFLVASGSRAQRMQTALQDMGASVLSGITITKFVGRGFNACHLCCHDETFFVLVVQVLHSCAAIVQYVREQRACTVSVCSSAVSAAGCCVLCLLDLHCASCFPA